jgi:hypothetical protein
LTITICLSLFRFNGCSFPYRLTYAYHRSRFWLCQSNHHGVSQLHHGAIKLHSMRWRWCAICSRPLRLDGLFILQAHCNKYRLHKFLFDPTGDRTRDLQRSMRARWKLQHRYCPLYYWICNGNKTSNQTTRKLPHVRCQPSPNPKPHILSNIELVRDSSVV